MEVLYAVGLAMGMSCTSDTKQDSEPLLAYEKRGIHAKTLMPKSSRQLGTVTKATSMASEATPISMQETLRHRHSPCLARSLAGARTLVRHGTR